MNKEDTTPDLLKTIIDKEFIDNEKLWKEDLPNRPFSRYGGSFMAKPEGKDGKTDIVEYGLIPSSAFTPEISFKYNIFTNYYWIRVADFMLGEVQEEHLQIYIKRISALIEHYSMWDYEEYEDKGKCGYIRTIIMKG